MLDNVRHPRAVLRRRAESDIEHLVLVVIGQKKQPGAALYVLQKIGGGI